MTSKQTDQMEDKALLERYRRASDAEASAPSDAVRAAILAEGRRVAEEFKKQGSQQSSRPIFDMKRSAANDSRWKIPAFGTMGVALLAALLIAPRYWETPPPTNASTTAPATAKAEIAATPPPPPKDADLSNGPVPLAAPAQNSPPIVAQNRNKENFASSKAAASPYAPLEEKMATASAARSANSAGSPLPSAAQSGDVAQTTALLDKGASVDARDPRGRTPLMLAIAQGQLEVVRLLLQRGANPNLADSAGKTPLQQATDQNFKDIAALLRDSGAR